MNTKQIEVAILNEIKSSKYYKQLKVAFKNSYFFTDKLSFPGVYIYSDGMRYHHISIGDRGEKSQDTITEDINELYFTIFDTLSFNVALKVANKNKEEDFRRELFKCQLEILSSINKIYEVKGLEKINIVLEKFPYDDTLY